MVSGEGIEEKLRASSPQGQTPRGKEGNMDEVNAHFFKYLQK